MIKVASINHFNGMNSKIPQDGDKIRVIAYLMRCVCGKVKVQLYLRVIFFESDQSSNYNV